jgi:hypothetical protein
MSPTHFTYIFTPNWKTFRDRQPAYYGDHPKVAKICSTAFLLCRGVRLLQRQHHPLHIAEKGRDDTTGTIVGWFFPDSRGLWCQRRLCLPRAQMKSCLRNPLLSTFWHKRLLQSGAGSDFWLGDEVGQVDPRSAEGALFSSHTIRTGEYPVPHKPTSHTKALSKCCGPTHKHYYRNESTTWKRKLSYWANGQQAIDNMPTMITSCSTTPQAM